MFNPVHLHRPTSEDRLLPGININIDEQLAILDRFDYSQELLMLPIESTGNLEFYYHNGSFESGDAEYLYNMIRAFKPARLIEVGCGNSTLLAQKAITSNRRNDSDYRCLHTCIEPFAAPWLETQDHLEIVRTKVELIDPAIFAQLTRNDILFIDSSHIIRPQGDVLALYLDILPRLNSGVLVHIHDIFLPRDYRSDWLASSARFWNEQYLLEAFLTCNDSFRVLGALNYLRHHYPEQLGKACPILHSELDSREPGSFWIVKQ
jgi:hypothetical protein